MSDHKNVIVKFKKDASPADKAGVLQDLQSKGGQVTKDDNVNSSIFPFAVVKLPVEHFHALHNEVQSGHHFVDHVEEDGTVHTQ
ncbi:hypothetical protein DB88DRAFT_497842 [Papiliotrema laurentii]|uniref:Inhibitor I9 domain-containing protein n=1 Tax=Papiliotrema laurentii TaxID=5418 RepID=A0AAD9D052_PAPLA|nr:hypothetical protein DB88DRAFT_497842 [Papiliotrema laurentii]